MNFLAEKTQPVPPSGNPCVPSPCGPNAQCRTIGETPACSCLPNYIGRPPNCRPECSINEECPGNLACQNERCRDPCPGSCGIHASCVVVKHAPMCSCDPGFTGDPFSGCSPVPSKIPEPYTSPAFHLHFTAKNFSFAISHCKNHFNFSSSTC